MTALPREQLSKRLSTLNNSQQSIEGTSAWCLFYRKDARSVVQVWESDFFKSSSDKKLSLLFLANHILQESKKKGREFIDEFYRVLPKALKAISKGADDKVKKSVGRVIQIWDERKVYGSSHIKALKEAASLGHSSHEWNHTTSGPDKKKLQLVGGLGDAMLALHQAEDHCADWAEKSLSSLRQGLTDNGTIEELSTAVRLLRSYQTALKAELAARDTVLTQLKALMSKQEDAKTRSDDQLRLCGVQQDKLEERIAILKQPPPRAPAPTPFVQQQTTPQYTVQAPSPAYPQQSTPPYAQPPVSSPANNFASVPVTSLTAGDTNFLGQLSQIAGVLNGTAGLNIPIAPAAPAAPFDPTTALAALSNFQAPPSPQPPKMEEYSPSAAAAATATVDSKTELDPAAFKLEDLDPASLAATLAGAEDLANDLVNVLASLPAEQREQLQRDFNALAQIQGGLAEGEVAKQHDEEEEYNPEYGD